MGNGFKFMVPVHNMSPFATELFSFPDLSGQEVLLLVVAATFAIDAGRAYAVVPQPPVCVADEFYGDPAASSIRLEANVALEKPFVDVIVNGSACAPNGVSVTSLPIELHVADIHKRLMVYGDRKRGMGGTTSAPEPFVTMPIVYERAYGGYDRKDADPAKHKMYRQNPVGIGYHDSLAADPSVETDFPNIEYPNGPVMPNTGVPAGFGVIGRGWSPRLQLAGTFGTEWLRDQWPLLPVDFQSTHYQAAPVDQQSRQIVGGEDVVLSNVTPRGDWRLKLPVLDIPIRLMFGDREELATPRLDTVLLQPSEQWVTLSARLGIAVQRDRRALKEIIVGHPSRAWLRAYYSGKRYIDSGKAGGSNRSKACWH